MRIRDRNRRKESKCPPTIVAFVAWSLHHSLPQERRLPTIAHRSSTLRQQHESTRELARWFLLKVALRPWGPPWNQPILAAIDSRRFSIRQTRDDLRIANEPFHTLIAAISPHFNPHWSIARLADESNPRMREHTVGRSRKDTWNTY